MAKDLPNLEDYLSDCKMDGKKLAADKRKAITFWVPAEYHSKFEELQSKTNFEFGKKIQDLIKKSIDIKAS